MRAAFALLAALSGCALTSKGEVVQPRYFGIEAAPTQAPGEPARLPLRLGSVEAGAHLRERLVFREPTGEVKFYEDLRWSEQPEQYARRALSQALFERAGLQQVLHGAAPTLDVEVLAFEEVRSSSRPPVARVRMTVALHDDRVVVWHETLTIDRTIAVQARAGSTDANATVRALASALDEASRRVASAVVVELRRLPPEED